MTENLSRLKLKPKRLSYLTSSASSTRLQSSDDLIAHLAPPAVLEAVTSPAGALRTCLECASLFQRNFILKAALASQRIWEWLAELDEWTWPAEDGSAGFESPASTQTEPINPARNSNAVRDQHLGCLPKTQVAQYESRIAQIQNEMEELDVEDIKNHVLTNYITPLSRPGTPMTDSNRPSSSLSNYSRLDDLSAVNAAIVLHMLPNMSRLSQLLRVWTIRLRVLHRIPSLTYAMKDAEAGLTSGRTILCQTSTRQFLPEAVLASPSLKREEFDVMRRVLASKVAEPGRILDGMLDCLDGMPDTLPEAWLDRVDALEKDFGEWVSVCKRAVQETETAAAQMQSSIRTAASPTVTDSNTSSRTQSPGTPGSEFVANNSSLMDPADRNGSPNASSSSGLTSSESAGLRTPSDSGSDKCDDLVNARVSSFETEGTSLVDDEEDEGSTLQEIKVAIDDPSLDVSRVPAHTMSPVMEDDEPELPRLRESASGASLTSQASTLVFGGPNYGLVSSDPPEVSASPVVPPSRIRHAKYVDDSPPSSPPLFPKPDCDDFSADLLDSPISSIRMNRESMFLKSPADQSFVDEFDDSFSVAGSLSQGDSGDQQLQQQLSEIIDAIPAKIKLASEPTAVNLNPPDIKIPRLRRRPSKEGFRRSVSNISAVSSRAGTPSFTLSPAKLSRPRPNRTHNDIKVYHLSRSTGEPPIKLFIRCVGEHGERVMVRVGGGWADLSEYLKEYASHHGRRSAYTEPATVEVRDVPRPSAGFAPNVGSSPSRPGSASTERSPMSPLQIHKTRRAMGAANSDAARLRPRTPLGASTTVENPPSSVDSTRSRSSSRLSWFEDDSSFLGLAGPTGKKVEMSEENRAWVESVKEKVRLASGERRQSLNGGGSRFGDLGRVGSTQRLFRKL